MTQNEALALLEGNQVSIALRSGDRLDDCQLVSAPRGGTTSLWLFDGRVDVFIPMTEVVALWECGHPSAAA